MIFTIFPSKITIVSPCWPDQKMPICWLSSILDATDKTSHWDILGFVRRWEMMWVYGISMGRSMRNIRGRISSDL
jgi:hypothetical protein